MGFNYMYNKEIYNIIISAVLLQGIKLSKSHNRNLHENMKSILHICIKYINNKYIQRKRNLPVPEMHFWPSFLFSEDIICLAKYNVLVKYNVL